MIQADHMLACGHYLLIVSKYIKSYVQSSRFSSDLPLAQLLDFWPQDYLEMRPSKSIQIKMLFIICRSIGSIRNRGNKLKGHTFLETYRNDLFTAHSLSSPLWQGVARPVRFEPAEQTKISWRQASTPLKTLTQQLDHKLSLDDMRHLLLHHDNHDSEMPYLLGLMSFSQRPLSQLLDFWPQGYPEVSPSECMCMWSEATLKSKQNMFLACFATVKLFFPSPLWPDFARQVHFVPANTDQNLSNDTSPLPLKSTQKLVDKMLLAWEKDQNFSMTSNLLKTVFLWPASRTVVGLLAPGLSGDEAFQINSNQNAVHNL